MGSQSINTLHGYVIPLIFINGLTYVSMRPFIDHGRNALPHVELTSDVNWGPYIADCTVTDDDTFFDCIPDDDGAYDFTKFDHVGTPRNTPTVIQANYHNVHFDLIKDEIAPEVLSVNEQMTAPVKRDHYKYHKYFVKAPVDIISGGRFFVVRIRWYLSKFVRWHLRIPTSTFIARTWFYRRVHPSCTFKC